MDSTPPPDFLWYPCPPQQVTANVNSGHLVWGPDYSVWDAYRIDMCSLVLNWNFADGNTSAELCLGDLDTFSINGPFLSVAAFPVPGWGITEYANKYHNQTETPIYVVGRSAIYARGESQTTSASTYTGTVWYSGARAPGS